MNPLLRPVVGGLLALAVCLAPAQSEARTDFRLTAGADFHFDHGAFFDVMGAVDFVFVGPLSVGARFGALLTTTPNSLGIPLDFDLRITPRNTPIYIEGLVGPWILFTGKALRAHAAFGFGYQGRSASVGLEIGYLDPSPHIGLRVGWRF